jgi:FtsH-binding integral membrane protein
MPAVLAAAALLSCTSSMPRTGAQAMLMTWPWSLCCVTGFVLQPSFPVYTKPSALASQRDACRMSWQAFCILSYRLQPSDAWQGALTGETQFLA